MVMFEDRELCARSSLGLLDLPNRNKNAARATETTVETLAGF